MKLSNRYYSHEVDVSRWRVRNSGGQGDDASDGANVDQAANTGTGGCTCNNKCYGHTGCTCDYECYSGYTCSCNGACYKDGGSPCSCESTKYAFDDPTVDEEDATYDKQHHPRKIVGRIWTCATESTDTPIIALESDDWAMYTAAITASPTTSEAWSMNELSGISAFGYAICADQDDLNSTFKLSAEIDSLCATIGYSAPRPIAGLHLYKNLTRIQSAYRPMRECGSPPHYSNDLLSAQTASAVKVDDADGTARDNYTYWPSATDYNKNTAWKGTGKKGGWGVFFTTSNSAIVKRYDIKIWKYKKRSPKSWGLCAFSGDPTRWAEIDTRSDITWDRRRETKVFDDGTIASNTTCANLYYLNISKTNSGSSLDYINPYIQEFRMYRWRDTGGFASNQSVRLMGIHYLASGDDLTVVPSITQKNDYIVTGCPSGNYISVTRLAGQGIL